MIAQGLLLLLALVDAAFSGYRVAAGYDGRIFKRRYYWTAIARGLVYGLAWVAVSLGVALALALGAPDPASTRAAYAAAAEPMVATFGVYAGVVFVAFVPYLFGGVELRNLASVGLFGPITLARRAVILVGGALGALSAAGDPRCLIALAVGTSGALLVDSALDRWRRARPLP